MGKLDGKVAVITSGSTGIGRGIGEAFLAEGAKIVINGRDIEKGERALKEMSAGERGHFIRGDVTVREDVDAVVDGAVEKFGRIDILVNNAGGLIKTAPVAGLADEDWDYAVKWNLYSAFWASRKALGYMLPQKSGRIIAVSSTAVQRGEAFHTHYGATKGAVISFVKGLSTELAPHNILVNCVAPGWVDTDMSAKVLRTKSGLKDTVEQIALGRVATADEIAGPLLFVASDLSTFITGEVLNVNGGAVLCG